MSVETVQLVAKLDAHAAGDLARTLLGLRCTPVVIDASGVMQLGTQSAQVLASAASTWAADTTAFRIADASPDFTETSKRLGLDALFAMETSL